MKQELETISSLPPYDLLYEGINLKEVIEDRGVRLLIPRNYLFGRQASQEYDNRKRRQIEQALKSDGVNFLRENPVIICAVSLNNQLLLAIIDGHHRNRYAGLYRILDMPCIVCTPDVMVEVINSNKPEEKRIYREAFIQQLLRETAIASSTLPENKQSTILSGVTNIDELKTRLTVSKGFDIGTEPLSRQRLF